MWKSPFIMLPTAGIEVWIRINWFYGVPVLATYNAETQEFLCSDTLIVVPVYIIGRWRYQTGYLPVGIGSMVVGSSFVIG